MPRLTFKHLLVAVPLILSGSAAFADILYRETFGTATTGGQGASQGYDWAIHISSTATNFSADTGTLAAINRTASASKPGTSDAIGQVNAGAVIGATPAAYGAGVAFVTQASGNALFWTPEYALTSGNAAGLNPTAYADLKFGWYQGNASTDSAWRLAIRLNGQWYASQQQFTNTAAVTAVSSFSAGGDDGNGGANHGAELKSFTYTNSASAWFLINFDGTYSTNTHTGASGTVLTLGAQPGANLSGNIDAFGLFSSTPGTTGNRRFDTFTITGTPVSTSPVVTTDLTNKVAELCASTSFTVGASGAAPLNYFWFANTSPAGGNSNSLVLNNLSLANGGNYFVIVSNATGTATSSVVSLTLRDTTLPIISQCATNQTLTADGNCQSAVPNLTNQIIASDCSGIATIAQSPLAGTLVGAGPQVVTFTITDNSNNVAACQATLTIAGSGLPVLVACAPNQFLNADVNQQAAVPNLTSLVVATNPCGSVTVTQSPPAGTIVGPGIQPVTLTAFTAGGSTNCVAIVTVNARPVAANQSVATALNTPLNLILGGSDAEGGPFTFLIMSSPAHGTLGTLNSNLVTYTPTTAYLGADAFTFAVSDGSVTGAVATVSITVTNSGILYPSGPQITKDGMAVLIENFANAPLSSRTTAIDTNGQLSRLNFMRAEPANAPGFGTRYFVCDLNRNFYIVPKADPLATNTWIKYINFEDVFPRFDNDTGFAGGLATFAFDPEYATNGIFYTVHMETNAAPVGPVNTLLPGLNLTGYTTTTAIAPPSGSVSRIAVLIEWRDTNITNTTFEGTAREVLRASFYSRIHPMGDLLFNPLATPGHPDYRNLYIAMGDGGAGETSGTTRTHPQQLDTLVGKILRITPDLNLRPTDELSTNSRYRIPTNGPNPNPFALNTAAFTNAATARHEIYAYGFRNPHRISWDAPTDRLIANDIGLNSWEEINIVHAGTNYGYSEREGFEQLLVPNGRTGSQQAPVVPFPASDLLTVTGLVSAVTPRYPVAAYSSRDGDAISSGFVYRGTLMPQLYGKYIFGDITTARLFYCDFAEMMATDDNVRNNPAAIREIQVVFNSPYDLPDQGVTNRRLFDIVAEAFRAKGGTNAQALPGGATVTGLTDTNFIPGGVPFGAGRADIRLALGDDDEIYIISKSDASIRKMVAVLSPPNILTAVPGGGNVTLTWQSVPGWKYRLQYKLALTDAAWTDIAGDVAAVGTNAVKSTAMVEDARFYRVKWVP